MSYPPHQFSMIPSSGPHSFSTVPAHGPPTFSTTSFYDEGTGNQLTHKQSSLLTVLPVRKDDMYVKKYEEQIKSLTETVYALVVKPKSSIKPPVSEASAAAICGLGFLNKLLKTPPDRDHGGLDADTRVLPLGPTINQMPQRKGYGTKVNVGIGGRVTVADMFIRANPAESHITGDEIYLIEFTYQGKKAFALIVNNIRRHHLYPTDEIDESITEPRKMYMNFVEVARKNFLLRTCERMHLIGKQIESSYRQKEDAEFIGRAHFDDEVAATARPISFNITT